MHIYMHIYMLKLKSTNGFGWKCVDWSQNIICQLLRKCSFLMASHFEFALEQFGRNMCFVSMNPVDRGQFKSFGMDHSRVLAVDDSSTFSLGPARWLLSS